MAGKNCPPGTKSSKSKGGAMPMSAPKPPKAPKGGKK